MAAKIVILDDSADLRAIMTLLIKSKLHEDCFSVAKMSEVIANKEVILASQLAILDINLGEEEPSGVDVYNWLKENAFKGKVFFLTGHARSHPLVAKACDSGAQVWSKPIVTDDIFKAMDEALSGLGK